MIYKCFNKLSINSIHVSMEQSQQSSILLHTSSASTMNHTSSLSSQDNQAFYRWWTRFWDEIRDIILVMNHVKVKQDGLESQFFSRKFPHELYNVMQPNEFDSIIGRINAASATIKKSKLLFISIPAVILGFILFIVAFVAKSTVAGVFGGIFFVGGAIFTGVLMFIHAREVHKAIDGILAQTNMELENRRISLRLDYKQSKKHFHKDANGKRGHAITKSFIVIEFPAPASPYMGQPPQSMPYMQPPGGIPMFTPQQLQPQQPMNYPPPPNQQPFF
ncbi:hypothetical protein DFA_07216 [Cavenderia fasciculata]|uniref:Transmembrane protein n=1 Tax=Cavenderia fasciculata TaxID=261658 RepID=F4PVT5_CACFS|nr:uncharacterized protein DFA_07216 [Cavenderia fasciculata]EGG20099.1 hypothetical protein DFA_07216 [Cavenderia fasciculata]|eukprot:XP_004367082.1 hypothetical protein DFA_07216 [Cavenderia fasciculata]